jgi:hypothetical protein
VRRLVLLFPFCFVFDPLPLLAEARIVCVSPKEFSTQAVVDIFDYPRHGPTELSQPSRKTLQLPWELRPREISSTIL